MSHVCEVATERWRLAADDNTLDAEQKVIIVVTSHFAGRLSYT
jgi:hypothetical protein